jgi:hypothetical protein
MGLLRRQLNLILSIAISFSIAMGPLHAQAGLGTKDERALAEEAFFLDLRFRIETFMQANKAKIRQIRTCIKAEMNPKKYRAVNPSYCKTQLGIVRDNIRVLYPRMRHYLITRELLRPANHRATYVLKKPFPDLRASAEYFSSNKNQSAFLSFFSASKPAKKLPDTFENPIEAEFDGITLPFAKASSAELKRAVEGFRSADGTVKARGYGVHQFYREACLNSSVVHANSMRVKEKIPRHICEQISLRFDEKTRSTSWDFASTKAAQYIVKNSRPGQSVVLAPGENMYDNKIDILLESLYHETIQTNPYVALVTSSNPNNQSLLWAFDQMYIASSKTLARFKEMQQRLDKERSAFKKTIDWFKFEDNRTRTLELLNYAPIAGHVLEVPGEKMDLLYGYPFEELAQTLMSENATAQFTKLGVQIAGLFVGNIVVCWLPWSRAASTVGRLAKISFTGGKLSKALSPMCFALTAIPINSYFLYHSIRDYAVAYEEIFSGIDEDQYETNGSSKTHFIREVRALSDAKSAIFWSLIFMPIGTKDVRIAMQKNIPSLSANAMKRIGHYLERRGY